MTHISFHPMGFISKHAPRDIYLNILQELANIFGKMYIIRKYILKTVATVIITITVTYEQVSVSSGIGRTEGPKFEMPLKL